MRLIDADALEKELTERIESEEQDGNYFNVESLDRAREYVIDTPTVTLEQAEKAVAGVQERCKAEMIDMLQEIKDELEKAKSEEWSGNSISDVGVGLEMAINIVKRVEKEYME